METLSSWIWNPVLSLVYLEIGIIFLFVTRATAWRGLVAGLKAAWRGGSGRKTTGDEVTHHHAFVAALAATVGVGNLAGVGTAIHLGGPGALFWMWVSALIGMSFRMSSAYFAIKLARRGTEAELFATPMLYLSSLLEEPWRRMTTTLAALMLLCAVASNLVQSHSIAHAVSDNSLSGDILVAVVLGTMVALVIVGGVRSIVGACVTAMPWLLVGYFGIGWFILLGHPGETLNALGSVFRYAFEPFAAAGGVLAYTVLEAMQFGISRGVFSHSSGLGYAAFWQGANKDDPAHGAFMAAAVPVVDTLVICTTTGLVILVAGLWGDRTGALLTVSSFQYFLGDAGRVAVTVALSAFAFTTIINGAYFSERCFRYLGGKTELPYRKFFVSVTVIGPFMPLVPLWSIIDILVGLMAITHLLPLTYIMIRHAPTMLADLSMVGK